VEKEIPMDVLCDRYELEKGLTIDKVVSCFKKYFDSNPGRKNHIDALFCPEWYTIPQVVEKIAPNILRVNMHRGSFWPQNTSTHDAVYMRGKRVNQRVDFFLPYYLIFHDTMVDVVFLPSYLKYDQNTNFRMHLPQIFRCLPCGHLSLQALRNVNVSALGGYHKSWGHIRIHGKNKVGGIGDHDHVDPVATIKSYFPRRTKIFSVDFRSWCETKQFWVHFGEIQFSRGFDFPVTLGITTHGGDKNDMLASPEQVVEFISAASVFIDAIFSKSTKKLKSLLSFNLTEKGFKKRIRID